MNKCTAPTKGHTPGSLAEQSCPVHGKKKQKIRKGRDIPDTAWIMGSLKESENKGELPILDYNKPETLQEMSQFVYDKLEEQGQSPVLVTIAGSWLYGTAHSESDLDLYAVINSNSKKNKQKVVGDLDVAQINMKTFVKNVYEGTHQAVEALWSPVAARNPQWNAYFNSLRVDPYRYMARARSAQESYDKQLPPEKAARASRRFEAQIEAIQEEGYFNPLTVSPDSYYHKEK